MTAPISFGVVSGSKPLSPSATESAPPTRAGGNTLAPVRKVDTLQLTDQGLELQQSMGSSRSHTDVDSQRVEQIRLAIADGRYPVDARSTALKLTRLEYELSQP